MRYDVVVIGAGPAGYPAALKAVERKPNVLLIDRSREHLGGVCLNRGCIPTKALLDAGKKLHELRKAVFLEPPFSGSASWKGMQENKEKAVAQIRGSLEKFLLGKGIRMRFGEARFLAPHRICVAGPDGTEELDFDAAVVAAGSQPFFPPLLESCAQDLLDTDKVLNLKRLPGRLAVIGGGAVGCEFSCLFRELGVEIHLIEMTSGLLPGEDEMVVRTLRKSLEARGIRIHTETVAEQAERCAIGWRVRLSSGPVLDVEQILVCAGRKPYLRHLELGNAGLKTGDRRLAVNERMQTEAPHIYAAGDVNGLSLLAHAATFQGEVAGENAAGGSAVYDGRWVPRCLYTWPEVASVGLGKKDAETQGIPVQSKRFYFASSGRALTEGNSEGFIQALFRPDTGHILGAQIIGPHATELIGIFSTALKAGFTRKDLKSVMFAHPTLAEGIREAL